MFWNRVRSQGLCLALGLTLSTGHSHWITLSPLLRAHQNTPQKCSGTGGKAGLVSAASLSPPHITRAFLRLFFPLTRHSIPNTRIPGTLAYGAPVWAMGPSEKYNLSNKYLTQSLPLTQSPRLGAGADHEVVRLARPDVLQRQDAPVPVPLALADVLHPLTRLGQGQHLHTNITWHQVSFLYNPT